MTHQELISSGLLEAYALGDITRDEILLVEGMLQAHPEIREELERVEITLEELAMQHAVEAPGAVRGRVMNDIAGDADTSGRSASVDRGNWLIAASIGALLLSATLNFYQLNEMRQLRDQVAALENDRSVLAEEMKVVRTSLDVSRNELAVLTDPDRRIIELKGLDIAPKAGARLYWDPDGKALDLVVKHLPPAPSGKQYQLWAIVDGVPVNAGMVPLGADTTGTHRMKSIETAQAFAITLEKEGGNATPTLELMYVMGEAG